ncbi:MAG: heparan-alpha-glucosaminide N-acetyltransferase [Candidatus Bipolaricaulota bacterium]|nr:DUF1624 domain-containing protein [Candidatus Bipolaricaulota bacterium]
MEKERFEEIDFVRGLAVVFMIAYHAMFDLRIAGFLDLQIGSFPFEVFANVTAGTFFSVVGISLYISFSRTKKEGYGKNYRLKKYSVRGIKLLGWGATVTVITYFLFPDMVILFGALHFIGVSVMLGYGALELTKGWKKFYRFTFLITIITAVFLISGSVRNLRVDNPIFLWLGIVPHEFQSLDYFPILPWFGLVVSGLILGEVLYPRGSRRWEFYRIGNSPLELLGRHALVVYFFHQPLIYLSIYLFALFSNLNESGLIAPSVDLLSWLSGG